jgi:hypothetical protein
MKKGPFLDKITTASHMPTPEGQVGFCSTSTDSFPDLEHTGIRTKFQPRITPTTNPHGRITGMYKDAAFEKVATIHRDHCALVSTEDVFKSGHKQFIDKVLLDMQESKMKRTARELKCYTSEKKRIGFDDTQFSYDKGGRDDEVRTDSPGRVTTRTLGVSEPRKIRVFNRMSLFNSILESTEPPKSPRKRYGLITTTTHSSNFDSSG